MSLIQLFSDDFSGYANQAAFEAAYPKDPPGDTSTSAVNIAWSTTNGPGGVPGVTNSITSSGDFGKWNISAPCGLRTFQARARVQFPTATGDCFFLHGYYHVPGSGWPVGTIYGDNVFQLERHGSDTLTTLVRTVASGQFDPNFYFEFAVGALPVNTPLDIIVDGRISTIIETSPGVFAPVADGSLQVSVNGSTVFSFAGRVWNGSSSYNGTPYWNTLRSELDGQLTNLELYEGSCSSLYNVLTGTLHSVTGSENLIAGRSGTVVGNRNVLLNLKNATPHTVTADNTFTVRADAIDLNGTVISGSGAALDDLSDVTITTPALDDGLFYNGSLWVNAPHRIRRTSVTLTDAQVKALPTTAITLVANQGSGKVVNWLHVDLFAKFASGAYTNVNTTFAYLNVGAAGGAQASLGIANDSTTIPAITQATTFFGATSKRARLLPYLVSVPVAVSSGYILSSSEDGTFALDAFADLNDTGIALTMDNNGSGNLTGGNAANVLKAVVYYSVESLP